MLRFPCAYLVTLSTWGRGTQILYSEDHLLLFFTSTTVCFFSICILKFVCFCIQSCSTICHNLSERRKTLEGRRALSANIVDREEKMLEHHQVKESRIWYAFSICVCTHVCYALCAMQR